MIHYTREPQELQGPPASCDWSLEDSVHSRATRLRRLITKARLFAFTALCLLGHG